MRKSFDGLSGLVGPRRQDVTVSDGSASGGGLFVFINRRRDRLKVLYFHGDGLAIWYKRLERGCFQLPPGSANPTGRSDVIIGARQLRLILDGIDLASVKRRKRYTPAPGSKPRK
ncbi:MAG: IS66 family insertion sequence element accessory protein TnpB [Phycisphaeraceae bacterium]